MAADRLDFLGDGECRAPLGALERHMLEKMSDTVDLGRLVAGPDIDPDTERNGVDGIDPVGGDLQPVLQSRQLNRHATLSLRRAWVRI